VRFLIDECLSVYLVTVARQAGHEAHHVAHIGRAGWKDWNVVRYARDGDFILVTNNASDFRAASCSSWRMLASSIRSRRISCCTIGSAKR
jgi:predicted nuclease of predicted toxin-antitoxin system